MWRYAVLIAFAVSVGGFGGFEIYRLIFHRNPPALGEPRVAVPPPPPRYADEGDGSVVRDLRRRNAVLAADVEAYAHRRATEDRLDIRIMGSAERFTAFGGGAFYTGYPIDRQKMLDLLPTLLNELDRYPPGVIRATRLQRIVVCTQLALDGKPEGGAAFFPTNTIYLTADWFDRSVPHFRQTFHHEIFHMIDWASGTWRAPDREWTADNPAGFHYGTGGFDATPENSSVDLSSATPGFLTAYSRSAIGEDKAEVYGWLMAAPDLVAERVRADPTLTTRTRRARAIAVKFSPKMATVVPAVE